MTRPTGRDRNQPCPCGSDKKRKVCLCWQIEADHEEALLEHEYRSKYQKHDVQLATRILGLIR